MSIELVRPDIATLGEVIAALRSWQRDDAPIQLHPGDLGWNHRSGAPALAASLRIWSRNGTILAVGLLDSVDVLRMTIAPEAWQEKELAGRVVADLKEPTSGLLPAGKAAVEVPDGTAVKVLLSEGAWTNGEAWTPLRLDLYKPVHEPQLHTEVVKSAAQISECTAVHRSAWGNPQFDDEKWHTMAAGPAFADGRCLLARDDDGVAVATVTVWSAGPGRPALIEPLGVHADHRRRGYGAAICGAAAAELRAMGSSSVLVCTPSSLHSAVATYEAAGYTRLPQRLDKSRDA